MAVMERKMTAEEIGRRGEALYNAGIRQKVETPENIGDFLALNIDTGEYAMATIMQGPVSPGCHALVPMTILGSDGTSQQVTAILDSGFNGGVMLPITLII